MRHFGLAQTSPSRAQQTSFDLTQPLDAARAAPALQRYGELCIALQSESAEAPAARGLDQARAVHRDNHAEARGRRAAIQAQTGGRAERRVGQWARLG